MTHQYDLLGEFYVALDSKGRFRLPSGLLKGLGDRDTLKFVVNRGFDNCLVLYPKPVWDEIKTEVDALNKYNRKNLQFTRLFYRGASELVPDSADRLLLPKQLLAWAKTDKNLVLMAMNDRIEIWAEAEYERLLNEEVEDYSSLAEDVLGGSSAEDEGSL
ncbi:division/cell wall cluster transcriptional repressor MraZ [Lewinella sp. JB7]|uniref:division/cell wall cluster transcriptional repressor MraZ n=1 Tax=Lewinella sp. JB7 TaxID=2962887 RepID=UPI0020C9E2EC|nr:division/cell wall cluster transcriptional repressor MraZ [Lewinella sp. JB7]MCP9235569.1 division/cell wall cluster transcriptional repressor MraZ [Lewinella sp. JB7]